MKAVRAFAGLFHKGSEAQTKLEGSVNQRSVYHAIGWARDVKNPAAHISVEAVIIAPDHEKIVGRAVADVYYGILALQSNDPWHGFQLIYDAPLSDEDYAAVIIRPVGSQIQLDFMPPPQPLADPRSGGDRSPIEGFIDQLTLTEISGWMVNRSDASCAAEFEILVENGKETRVIASGKADQPYPSVQRGKIEDADRGFKVRFADPLTQSERDSLIVRSRVYGTVLSRNMEVHGVVDELSNGHVAGWVRNRFKPEQKLDVEAILITPDGEQTLALGVADLFHEGLALGAPEDGCHGFHMQFGAELTSEHLGSVHVRLTAHDFTLPNAATPGRTADEHPGRSFLGYIDDATLETVSGWLLDADDTEVRVDFEVIVAKNGGERLIANGIADLLHPGLQSSRFTDLKHGFAVKFGSKLTIDERNSLMIRPTGHAFSLPRAPSFQGFVDELTTQYALGWVYDRFRPEEKLAVEAVFATGGGEQVLGRGVADRHHEGLAKGEPENACHGFTLYFEPPLAPDQLALISLKLVAADFTLKSLAKIVAPDLPPAPVRSFLGYVDDISNNDVSGWLLDVNNTGERIKFEVVVAEGNGERLIAGGIAELFYPALQSSGFGDAEHGFAVALPYELTNDERNSLIIRPAGHEFSLPRAPSLQGYVDELTRDYALGWVHDRFRPEEKLGIEAVISDGGVERVLNHGTAERFHAGLALGSPQNAHHGFVVKFIPPLAFDQLTSVSIRIAGTDFELPSANPASR